MTTSRLLPTISLESLPKNSTRRLPVFSESALKLLQTFTWPGNVRQLQSVVKRALLEANGSVLVPAFLPELSSENEQQQKTGALPKAALSSGSANDDLGQANSPSEPNSVDAIDFVAATQSALASTSEDIYRELICLAEKPILQTVLHYTQGNISEAARRLGITRSTLRAKLASLGITLERSSKMIESDR